MISARDIANTPIEVLWNQPFARHTLQFDDGILETDTRKTLFSRYIWEIQRLYPETPLLMRHHIGNERLGGDTHLRMLRAIWDCWHTYRGKKKAPHLEQLCLLGYEITNRIFNEMSTNLEPWVSSIDYFDFLDVMNHPQIKEAMENVVPNNDISGISIDDTYAIIKKVLITDDSLKGNNLARAARAGLVRMGQIVQCVGPRGYPTDIDSYIFRDPILKGFAHGITKLADSMTESRSASKAIFFQGDPMADSEYFNRQLQLLCEVVREVVPGDCGSKIYIPWTIQQGTLKYTTGIWRWDESQKKEVVITEEDRQLVGKTVQIRSVFGCKHKDRNAVCARCLGEIAHSIPAGTILGHTSAIATASPATQRVLSVKHEDGSASVEPIVFNDIEASFLVHQQDPAFVALKPHLKGNKITIVVSHDDSPNLHDLEYVEDVSLLSPSRYFALRYVKLFVDNGKGGEHIPHPLRLFVGSRYGFFTPKAMQHIKKKGWVYDNQGNYVIDFTEWDFEEALVEIPKRHYSAMDHMTAIKSYIMGIKFQGEPSIIDQKGPVQALAGLQDLVFQRLSVHLSHLQVTILATLAEDPFNNDFRLPLDRLNRRPVAYDKLLAMRSIGGAFAYQGQWSVVHSPLSYLVTDRTPHPLDNMLLG